MPTDLFTIKGKKDLIFKKDNDDFWVYDPIALEYYVLDDISAEIMYCISKRFSIDKIIDVLMEEYEIEYNECKQAIIDFLNENPLQYIFYTNLIQSGIYLYLFPFFGVE